MEIHCKYTGIEGFVTLYRDALRYRYMITDKALYKAKVLAHWEKFGIESTLHAFSVKERTLYDWKTKFEKGGRKLEVLNDLSRAPQKRRKRIWPHEVIEEIKRLRYKHPNLGKEKIYPLLKEFCDTHSLVCPKSKTIGRIISDCGGLRIFPTKISPVTGRVKPINRRKNLRKPKDFKALYPGHCVALDTIEKHIQGRRRYIITFEDLHTRFSFAWATTSHASKAAAEFFGYCRRVFPFPFEFQYVLTDNGSEFKKHFDDAVRNLHMTHYHTYPKTPKMNAHVERFNRTLQEEFADYHISDLLTPHVFNRKLIDWLIFYNTRRVHYAFDNKLSPVQFMLSLQRSLPNRLPSDCNIGWPYTFV